MTEIIPTIPPAITVARGPTLIYTRVGAPPRLSIFGRLIALGIATAALAVLIVAVGITPNPAGVGTHTTIPTLETCNLLMRTGLPCPSCGMTTSFAWFVRGNLIASLYVQPMGALLALLTTVAVWVGGYVAITGRPAHRLVQLIPSRYYLIPLLSLAVLAWAWKMFLQFRAIDGWG